MILNITLKQVGKRKPAINQKEIEVKIENNTNLKSFLKALVSIQVSEFNSAVKSSSKNLENITSTHYLPMIEQEGKTHFGIKYNQTLVDLNTAEVVALLAFEDGLFAVFLNGNEIEKLDQVILLSDYDHVAIVKLTFLSGNYW